MAQRGMSSGNPALLQPDGPDKKHSRVSIILLRYASHFKCQFVCRFIIYNFSEN